MNLRRYCLYGSDGRRRETNRSGGHVELTCGRESRKAVSDGEIRNSNQRIVNNQPGGRRVAQARALARTMRARWMEDTEARHDRNALEGNDQADGDECAGRRAWGKEDGVEAPRRCRAERGDADGLSGETRSGAAGE